MPFNSPPGPAQNFAPRYESVNGYGGLNASHARKSNEKEPFGGRRARVFLSTADWEDALGQTGERNRQHQHSSGEQG